MPDRPNVLFIISDQHNAKVLGHKGHAQVRTPNLDRLAAEGVRFDNAVTQNPICTPSRMCYFSGQYAHNHGYYGLSGPNPGGLPTVLGHFRRAGYRTAAVGKIHCPEYWVEDDCDVFHETCECSIDGRSKAYADFLAERGKLELEDHGALTEFGERGRQSMEGRPSPLSFEESQEGWIASTVIDFMRDSARQDQPFIVQASLPRPHQCTAPSEPFWSMYEDVEPEMPPNFRYEMQGKAPHLKRTVEHWRTGDWTLFEPHDYDSGARRKLRGYLGAVSQVDHAVGLMLEALKDSGLEDNTIVIYCADHGDYACEHGAMEKAPGICADAITRIPYIWRWPGRFKAGHVVEAIAETVDLAPTLCDLAGLPPMETADGRPLSGLLAGGTEPVHRIGVTEFAWSKSVRQGPWRLVHYPREMFAREYPEGFGELYNLEDDPWEMTNLYFDPAHGETVRRLKDELTDWPITTTRPTTVFQARPVETRQGVTRYHNTVNFDGKIHPDRIRKIAGTPYV